MEQRSPGPGGVVVGHWVLSRVFAGSLEEWSSGPGDAVAVDCKIHAL